MRRALPFAILGACLVVGVLPALAADQSVAIHDFRYAPASVAVKPGESVTWRADGYYMHSVHFDAEATGIGTPSSKYTASRTFPDEGKFAYHCDVHASMHGVVYVNQSGTVPAPPADADAHADRDRAGARRPPPPPRPAGAGPPRRSPPSARRRRSASARSSSRSRSAATRRCGCAGRSSAGASACAASACSRGPGATSSACRARRLKPGRYTLTLKAGDLRRVVHFRVRRS